ncbi:hypothetical protein [Eleftheria terrae]|uniref:hypothetical protein n=1 Tax=Eleftheria terrae TaxID=1597781 RepID=UPI00263AF93F|nr:hypothetical protein [Eleftheria terrae]WKB50560.1 hypothetical protein N7L95_00130 [Eleftheria terrae]
MDETYCISEDLRQAWKLRVAKERRMQAVTAAMFTWTFLLFVFTSPFWLPTIIEDPLLSSSLFFWAQLSFGALMLIGLVVGGGHLLFPSLRLRTYLSHD